MEERKEGHESPLVEFEAKAKGQLVLLDLSVSVDVAVAHQGFPELVQVRATDARLRKRVGDGGVIRGQRSCLLRSCWILVKIWLKENTTQWSYSTGRKAFNVKSRWVNSKNDKRQQTH